MKFAILFFCVLTYGVSAGQNSPEEFNTHWMQAKFGAMVIYNGTQNSFSLNFVAKTFEPAPQQNFVLCDGVLMQTSIAPFDTKTPIKQPLNIGSQKVFLNSWREFEKKWLEEQLKVTGLVEKVEFPTINNKVFLLWICDTPTTNPGSAIKQMYLVTICFNQMLILNGPVIKGKSELALKDRLIKVAETLELNSGKVIDLDILYSQLQK